LGRASGGRLPEGPFVGLFRGFPSLGQPLHSSKPRRCAEAFRRGSLRCCAFPWRKIILQIAACAVVRRCPSRFVLPVFLPGRRIGISFRRGIRHAWNHLEPLGFIEKLHKKDFVRVVISLNFTTPPMIYNILLQIGKSFSKYQIFRIPSHFTPKKKKKNNPHPSLIPLSCVG
jgi:hypothetical protein